MKLETKRLILKKVEKSDAEELFKIFSDKELTRYFVSGADCNLEQTKARVEKINSHWEKYYFGDFILLDKKTTGVIGFGGLHYKTEGGNINISYIIDKNLWGNGLGYETCLALLDYGFNILGLDKIVAEIDPQNIPSINLIEKCGFKFNKTIEYKGYERLEYVMLNSDFNRSVECFR